MTWDNRRDPKYATREHRQLRKQWAATLHRDGAVTCAQPVCIMGSRLIHDGDDWALGHDETGTRYIGPVHDACNTHDAAVRGHAASRGRESSAIRWDL